MRLVKFTRSGPGDGTDNRIFINPERIVSIEADSDPDQPGNSMIITQAQTYYVTGSIDDVIAALAMAGVALP